MKEEIKSFDYNDLAFIALYLLERAKEGNIINCDLSDCGNEIGLIVGGNYPNMTAGEIDDFIIGFRHGISLTNGTH